MKIDRVVHIMQNEQKCVVRASTSDQCNRDCSKCDLVLPTGEILEAYDYVLKVLNNIMWEKKFLKDMAKGGAINGST